VTEPTSLQRAVALTGLALMLVHAIVGFIPAAEFPSWQMYIGADRFTYTLVDRDGNAVDILDSVTPDFQRVSHQHPAWIAHWLAQRRPELAPLTGTVTVGFLEDGRPGSRTYVFRADVGEEKPAWDVRGDD
jgi:hypothetical protein